MEKLYIELGNSTSGYFEIGRQIEMSQHVQLKVGKTHAQEIAKCSNALLAIEELIWNSLDADASEVSVVIQRNLLDVIDHIEVVDDGEGIHFDEWKSAFGQLGDSKKLKQRATSSGRVVHGESGKGRLKAIGVGSLITWKSRYQSGKTIKEFSISVDRSNLKRFTATQPKTVRNGKTGVSVEIRNLDKGLAKLKNPEIARADLSQKFCLYLSQYPSVVLKYDGERLDPESNKAHESKYPLSIELSVDKTVDAELTVIEWNHISERSLYLCDSNGFARDEQKTRIKKSTGWNFSAYLRSSYVDELEGNAAFGWKGLDSEQNKFLESGQRAIEAHFLERESERSKQLVEIWKTEKIYPYESIASNLVQSVEQKVFDVCAMNVHNYIRDFGSSSKTNRRLTFRLLKETLAQDPTNLGRILREIVALPKQKQDELAEMLNRAKLSAIISASNQVISRLRFLDSLDDMIFGSLSNTLNEPRQLHRILVNELWVFGDQYSLGADEKGLKNVLKAHIQVLGRKDLVTQDVKLLDGKDARLDLMLWRQIPTSEHNVEHLVIELKRPSIDIGSEEIRQIRKYANKVSKDDRFDKSETKWRFVLVGKGLDEDAQAECENDDRKFGHIQSGNPGIFVTTWASLIRDARYRYDFFKKELALELNDDDGLKYLRERYSEYFADDWSVPKKRKKRSRTKSAKTSS